MCVSLSTFVNLLTIVCGNKSLGLVYEGERLGRGIVTDALTTPVVNTSAYFFRKTADLLDFKVCIALIDLFKYRTFYRLLRRR